MNEKYFETTLKYYNYCDYIIIISKGEMEIKIPEIEISKIKEKIQTDVTQII